MGLCYNKFEVLEVKKFAVGVLSRNGKFLAEKRGIQEDHFAGLVTFPGGLIEKGEIPEVTLVREMEEELGVKVKNPIFIGEFLYDDGCSSFVYLVKEWNSEPKPLEAEGIMWVDSEGQLSNEYDRKILRKIVV